jgi:hypothetical protein
MAMASAMVLTWRAWPKKAALATRRILAERAGSRAITLCTDLASLSGSCIGFRACTTMAGSVGASINRSG